MKLRILVPIFLLLCGCSHHPSPSSIANKRLVDTRIDLALAYMETGNLGRADFHLQRAAQISSESLRYHLAKIHYYELTQQNQKALNSYLSLLKKNKTNPNLLNNFALYQCRHATLKQATELFEKGIRHTTGALTGVIYKNAAICALNHNDYLAAQKLFTKALHYQPDNQEIVHIIEQLKHKKLPLPVINAGSDPSFQPTFNDI
ncbi:hypothetical protein [Vibrio salinus]|uniref:hypothetical protein n=1 Tax=Vibrio salinus TaxID=2899784 RepID=UPI001E4CC16F|nr:hypothetical protein [Vibrio salinus]MCE0492401.1 hypothetical protein [Vibrio salinus]